MKSPVDKTNKTFVIVTLLALTVFCANASAVIPGITQSTYNFTAKTGYISTPDGGSYLMWGYSDDDGAGTMQYPSPTIIINEGDNITINLTNELPESVSMVFPGQSDVNATGGIIGLLTHEAPANGATVVTYQFTASNPGTYLYHSGTKQELQVEMGLVGAIIVRPSTFDPNTNKIAYGHSSSAYDREYLFLHTEMDPTIHQAVEYGLMENIDNTTYFPVYWFLNGRCFPDTILAAPESTLLPTQPYNILPRMHPGEKVLMRMIGAGRDAHPFHPHSNNFINIARDARLLESTSGAGADLGFSDYILNIQPGSTQDAIFEWTGEKLGWDIYGHDANDPNVPEEYMPDHGKPFPVILPEQKDITLGALYSGSPFLGGAGVFPPGQGGLNLTNGYFQIWHSHHEKEIVNNDLFPGGQITFLLIDHPDINIP